MAIPFRLEKTFLKTADYVAARFPRATPAKSRLKECRLISHRGAYDNRHIIENSLPAFERIKAAGVWGLELDVRWTKDLQPVVFHDADLKRLFGSWKKINELTLPEIKSDFPLIPSLKEVVDRYGRTLHLMVEIKAEPYPAPEDQNARLREIFRVLTPGTDYHFLTLTPPMFDLITYVPAKTFIPIAETNVSAVSRLALEKGYRGISGHFLMIRKKHLKHHQHSHQIVTTGFVNSRNCMFRELNRGITWLFSQKALLLQAELNRMLA